MRTKRSHEGYIMVDHRESPGLTDAQMRAAYGGGSGRGLHEVPALNCAHCHKSMIVNPLRTRDRPWCRKCDAYVCDDCKLAMVLTEKHRPMSLICDEVQESAARGLPILGATHG